MKPDDKIYRWMTPCPRTIRRDATLTDAHALMRKLTIRHLPVLDDGTLVGVVSESDLAFAERFVDASRVSIDEIMTRDLYLVVPYAPLAEVADEMAARRLGSAIVVDSGNVVGVFTATDALRAIAEGSRDRGAPARRVTTRPEKENEMATKSERAHAEAEKKGPRAKKVKKLAQRKKPHKRGDNANERAARKASVAKEESQGKPSRKSTRSSANRGRADVALVRRASNAAASADARARRAQVAR